MRYPLKKELILSSEQSYLANYNSHSILCLPPHLGSFGKVRKNHIHEGIDLYCENNDEVSAMEDGIILDILPFTGIHANSPWWHNTFCVLIKHSACVLNYGEIIPLSSLKIGDKVKEGELLGHVTTVLKKDKGLPMSMLHLEQYSLDTTQPIKEWSLNTAQPLNLQDPTQLLLSIYFCKNKKTQ